MTAIYADDIFNCMFLNENDRILIQISLKYVPRSLISNKPALVQVMAWRRSGNKPLLPGQMQTRFTDAYNVALGGMSESLNSWKHTGVLFSGCLCLGSFIPKYYIYSEKTFEKEISFWN